HPASEWNLDSLSLPLNQFWKWNSLSFLLSRRISTPFWIASTQRRKTGRTVIQGPREQAREGTSSQPEYGHPPSWRQCQPRGRLGRSRHAASVVVQHVRLHNVAA